jgi:hypothetical protein
MTSSHVLGLIMFGIFAVVGVLGWLVSYIHPSITGDPRMVRKTRRTAMLLVLLGVVVGYAAFKLDNREAVTTLYEVLAEGSEGATPGAAAPVRSLRFDVEHPGVKHGLLVEPVPKGSETPTSAVNISFSLHGPTGEALVPERTEHFDVIRSQRKTKIHWEGKTVYFTPSAAGPHIIRVIPLTKGIPSIHVRVKDSSKRDGKRGAGY